MQFAMRAADDEGEQADDFGTGDEVEGAARRAICKCYRTHGRL